jgi:hypothetical protein
MRWTVLAVAAGLATACGGSSEECAGGCPEGQVCYYGTCVPAFDGSGDGEVEIGREDGGREGDDGDGRTDDARPEGDEAGREDGGCDPTAREICIGVDDNCNGLTDEGFPCSPGAIVDCTTSCGTPGSGACTASCTPPGPAACATDAIEVCNGVDDDCDTTCDDGFACCAGELGARCTTSCGSAGTTVCGEDCTAGVCVPPDESCNGADDDCDTTCDEGFGCCRGTTIPCTTTCRTSGTRTCGESCAYPITCTPPEEVCNGIDDDCDTTCDDGFACCAGASTFCWTECGTRGTALCSESCAAAEECTPPEETCNGADDDCDTTCDEGSACCAGTVESCDTTCGSTGERLCSPDCLLPADCEPPPETCGNGVDDDCDGSIDEDCAANDTCDGALPIASGETVTGTTAAASDDSQGSCHEAGAPDVYYWFDVTEGTDVFLHTVGSGYDTTIYASATCGESDLGCHDDIERRVVRTSRLTLADLDAGRYYVAVDGYYSTSLGDYALTMYATPAGEEGDRCGNPVQIPRGSRAVTGDSCDMTGDYAGSCGGSDAEAVLWFVTTDRRTITFSTCNSSTSADTVLYVRDSCTADTPEAGCNDTAAAACASNPGAAVLSVTVDAGIHFLFVDTNISPTPACGPFRVDITGL